MSEAGIISGTIKYDGTVLSGTNNNFKVAKALNEDGDEITGLYKISYASSFEARPIVLATAFGTELHNDFASISNGHVNSYAYLCGSNRQECYIQTGYRNSEEKEKKTLIMNSKISHLSLCQKV